jgi:hypothetical protein
MVTHKSRLSAAGSICIGRDCGQAAESDGGRIGRGIRGICKTFGGNVFRAFSAGARIEQRGGNNAADRAGRLPAGGPAIAACSQQGKLYIGVKSDCFSTGPLQTSLDGFGRVANLCVLNPGLVAGQSQGCRDSDDRDYDQHLDQGEPRGFGCGESAQHVSPFFMIQHAAVDAAPANFVVALALDSLIV